MRIQLKNAKNGPWVTKHKITKQQTTNTNFLTTLSLQPDVDLSYFKLWLMLGQIFEVWNIQGLHTQVVKI